MLVFRVYAFLFLFCGILSACNRDHGPEPVELGRDQCHTCRMSIVNARYGGQVRTKFGKLYKFDSLDCLIGFYRTQEGVQVYLPNFTNPGTFIAAESASIVELETKDAPMGSRFVAFPSLVDAQKVLGQKELHLKAWSELVQNIPE